MKLLQRAFPLLLIPLGRSLYAYSTVSSVISSIRSSQKALNHRNDDGRQQQRRRFSPHRGLQPLVSFSSESESSVQSWKTRVTKFCDKNFFLVGMFVAVALAKVAPDWGRNGGILRIDKVIGQGVTLIFLLSGLSLELSQLTQAIANIPLNLLIQFMTFGAWPVLAVPLTRSIAAFQILPAPLIDGLLILMTLPTTVNMCVILTSSAGGNVAAALCNSVLSNLIGIFLTPAWLFYLFGSQIRLPFLDMVIKLLYKVLLPVVVGQALRATPLRQLAKDQAKTFKRMQEILLLSILWNAFCTAMSTSMGLELRHGLILLILLPTIHLVGLAGLYAVFASLQFPRDQVVAAMFCASQKTLAFGLPLVQTIFDGNPNLAAYCAPIMFIHPIQLIVGSALVPKLERYVQQADRTNESSLQ